MKNNVTIVLIGLVFTAGAAYSEPVEHTFSTGDPIFIDPLLTGLTSVSGSFTYENGVAPFGAIGAGGMSPGSTTYVALSNLSGNANGNSFSDPQGLVVVGDDKRLGEPTSPVDIVAVNWEPGNLASNFSGFSFAGMPLVNIAFSWFEGRDGIGDFLENQSLPSVLPPNLEMPGRLTLLFDDGAGGLLRAIFGVTTVPIIPANTDIKFSGEVIIVDPDIGGGVYSGVPSGSNFSGAINRLTSDGFISHSGTRTSVGCCIDEGRGLVVTNDLVLDAEDVAFLASLGITGFVSGNSVDLIEIGGDAPTAEGGHIGFRLIYVLDSLAFDDESRNNYPPNPNDIVIPLFLVEEVADRGLTISFDTFDNLGSDALAIDVHVDGTLVGRDLTNPFTNGSFVPVDVNFDADGTLDLTFDGNPIFVDLPTGFTPQSTNRFGFGARTGAGNAVQRVDNVSISACMDTIGCPPPDGSYVNEFGSNVGLANLFGDAVLDSGSVLLTDSINFQLGSLVIDDLVPAGIVSSFAATFDLQMGPSSGPPGPADGISFNLGPLPDDAFGEEGAQETEIYFAAGTFRSSGSPMANPASEGIFEPGTLLVVDPNNGIARVDPVTGDNEIVFSGGELNQPIDIVIDASGDIIVADVVQNGDVVRVNPRTGTQQVISSGGLLTRPIDVAIDPLTGDLLVANFGSTGSIVRVDPRTGAQTLVAAGDLRALRDIQVEKDGMILVARQTPAAILRIDPETGTKNVLSSGGFFSVPFGMTIDAADGSILVVDNNNKLLRIHPLSGAQTLITADGLLSQPTAVEIEADGNLIVTSFVGGGSGGRVTRIDPLTGAQTPLVSGGLGFLQGLAIVVEAPSPIPVNAGPPGGSPPGMGMGMGP